MGCIVAGHRVEQIGWWILGQRVVGKLPGITSLGEVAIDQARCDAIAQNRLYCGKAQPYFTPLVRGREEDRP